MDKSKNINLKRQLLSLKFFYEELVIENKALTSEVNYLETIFKQTKQYTRQKNTKNIKYDLNLKKDKMYQNINNKRMNLMKNIEKQNKTLKNSILFNKYIELQKEKEILTQTLEEKKSNMNSIQAELNLYKKYNPYNFFNIYKKLKSKIYLNEALDLPLLSQKKSQNNKNDIKCISLIKPKFKRNIIKEKIEQKKMLTNAKNEMQNLYEYFLFYYKKSIKDLGFQSILTNKKNNKTYIISIEPNQLINKNSSDSDSNDDNESINKSNSIDERLFIDNIKINKNAYNNNNKKNKYINSKSIAKNSIIANNKQITELNLVNINNLNNTNSEINMISNFANKSNFCPHVLTEGDVEKINGLNTKLLKIKENYYNCLDNRYQLKSELKENISLIYKTKERIKKIKKQNNIK